MTIVLSCHEMPPGAVMSRTRTVRFLGRVKMDTGFRRYDEEVVDAGITRSLQTLV